MDIRLIFAFSLVVFSAQISAVECHVTLLKDKCWDAYEIDLHIENLQTHDAVLDLTVGPHESIAEKTFECQPNQILKKTVRFSPAVWEGDQNKTYDNRYLTRLPDTLPQQGGAWSIELCFPESFAKVPDLGKSIQDCGCPKKNV